MNTVLKVVITASGAHEAQVELSALVEGIPTPSEIEVLARRAAHALLATLSDL